MYDIVYILKQDINKNAEELRYSLRSVEKNFPYRSIWFAGGIPDDIIPDHYLKIQQNGHNKWLKVKNTLDTVCRTPEITDNFWLFNDDFFIMKPVTDCPIAVTGTMSRRIQEIMYKNNISQYAKELFVAKKILEDRQMETMNYALHIPILINKAKALETLRLFENTPMFRCCYGNHHNLAETVMPDVKIHQEDIAPTGEETYLSTSDKSFMYGEVGKYIREQFPEKSKYEIERISAEGC